MNQSEIHQTYSIEDMMEVFSCHIQQALENQIKMKAKFIENNPGIALPDYMNDDFMLPKAMYSLCYEISKLKGDK